MGFGGLRTRVEALRFPILISEMTYYSPVKLSYEKALVTPLRIVEGPSDRKYPEWVTCDDIGGYSNYGPRDKIKICSVLAFTGIGSLVYSIKLYNLLLS